MNLAFVLHQSLWFLMVPYGAFIGGSLTGLSYFYIRRATIATLVVVTILWLIAWARRRFPFPRTRLDLAWLIWLLGQGAATALSPDPRRGLTSLALTGIYALVFYIAVDVLRRSKWDSLLFASLVLSGVVLIVPGLLQIVTWFRGWWSLGGWADPLPPATIRVQSIAAHANHLAAMLNLLLPFGVGLVIQSRNQPGKIGLGLLVGLGVVVMLGTSSRGGWLGSATAVGLLAALLGWDRRSWLEERWMRLRSQPIVIGLLALLLVAGVVATFGLAALLSRHPTHGALFHSRQSLWEPAWQGFRDRPIWGQGATSYASWEMRSRSLPPDPFYSHAHSFPLNTLLESGLVGAIGLATFCVIVTRSAWIRWQRSESSERPMLAASLAALGATGIHSLVETPQDVPGFCFLVVLILAQVESADLPPPRPRMAVFQSTVLALGGVTLIAGMIARLPVQAEYAQGIGLANGSNCEAAAGVLDQVARKDPALASNWFQAAHTLAKAGLDSGDEGHLRTAVDRYRRGLALDPSLSVHWAQLGALLRQLEDGSGAQQAFREAVDRAPREAAYLVTLGKLEEETGRSERAGEYYERGLTLRPWWVDSTFWEETAFREATRDAWLEKQGRYSGQRDGCWTLLDEGDVESARECFLDAQSLNEPGPFYGLAMTSWQAGDPAGAEIHLRRAVWVAETASRAVSDRQAAHYRFALADVLAERGKLREAAKELHTALDALKGSEPRAGLSLTTDYTRFVYGREAIVDDVLPGIVWIWATEEAEQAMWQLIDWYEELGQYEKAARVCQMLSEILGANEKVDRKVNVFLSVTEPRW